MKANNNRESKPPVEQERQVEQVECVPHVCHITVPIAARYPESQSDVVSVLEALDRAGIKISLLKVHQGFTDFIVEEGYCKKEVLEQVLQRAVDIRHDCAIVTLKSDSMRRLHGIMASAVQALYNKDIQVYQTGDSYDSMSVVIDGKNAESAVQTLAKQFEVKSA